MKRLFVTVSLLGILVGNSAYALSWETSVGGYMNIGGGFTSYDPVLSTDSWGNLRAKEGFQVIREGQIQLKGSLTADNGLVFGVRVDLEGYTTSDQIDENYATLSGSFGTIMIGSNDTASYNVGYAGIGSVSGPFNYYDHTLTLVPGTDQLYPTDAIDSPSIFYTSPSFSGFQFGVSYSPDNLADGSKVPGSTLEALSVGDVAATAGRLGGDLWSFGAMYSQQFERFSVTLGAGYSRIMTQHSSTLETERDVWHLGTSVGFAGFQLHGYYENKGKVSSYDGTTNRATLESAGSDIALGMDYTRGPWSVGGGYAWNTTSKDRHATVSGSYTLAPGAKLIALVEYGEAKDVTDQKVDGVAGAFFVNLSF